MRLWTHHGDPEPVDLETLGMVEFTPNKVAMQQVVLRYQPDFDDPDYVDELWDAALSEDRM
jgi:hypothetical protein